MTPLMHAAVGVGGKLWTGNNGVTRVYLNNWYRLAGLEIDHYNTGNIRNATFANGDRMSNCAAREVINAKCYVDSEGLHMPRINGTGRYFMDDMTEAVKAALTAKLEELSNSSM